jgi:P5-type ATPase cation transporter
MLHIFALSSSLKLVSAASYCSTCVTIHYALIVRQWNNSTFYASSFIASFCDLFFQKCYGYRRSLCRLIPFYILSVLSVGTLYLVTHWKPSWRLLMTSVRCGLSEADTVLLEVREQRVNWLRNTWLFVTVTRNLSFPCRWSVTVLCQLAYFDVYNKTCHLNGR